MSKADTWMPLYIGDYLADTQHLDAAEHGAYLLLIMQYWRGGPLLDDDGDLARLTKMPEAQWAASSQRIKAFFKARKGRLYHGRIDAEKKRAENNSKKRAISGALGGAAKAKNAKLEQQVASNCQDFAKDLQGFCSTPLPLPLPSKKEKESKEVRAVLRTDEAVASPCAEPELFPVPLKPITARSRLWSEGIPIISQATGKPPGGCRTLLVMWLKRTKDDCQRLLNILHDAETFQPIEFVSWVTAAVDSRMTKLSNAEQILRELGIEGSISDPDWLTPSADVVPFPTERRLA